MGRRSRHSAETGTSSRTSTSFRRFFAKPVDHTVMLTLRNRKLPSAVSAMLIGINASVDWNDGMSMMNWVATGNDLTWVLRDQATGAENMGNEGGQGFGEVLEILGETPVSSEPGEGALDYPTARQHDEALFAAYAGGGRVGVVVLIALFVTLIPTTIGALYRRSALRAWTASSISTCSQCRAGRSRRQAVSIRYCSTRPARSPSGTGLQPN